MNLLFEVTPLLQTIGLPFVVTQCYANNDVQSCIFHTKVPSYVIQGQGGVVIYCHCQYYVAISTVGFQEAINILTGSTKYQGTYPKYPNYQGIPSRGWRAAARQGEGHRHLGVNDLLSPCGCQWRSQGSMLATK